MAKNYQPPIGVSPTWFVITRRIDELSQAISRYSKHERMGNDEEVTRLIKAWSREISMLCDVLDEVERIKKEVK